MPPLRALFYGSALYHLALSGPTPSGLRFRLPHAWPGDPERGAALLGGVFRFDGETAESPTPPWSEDRRTEWRAELHRFLWLADLAALGSAEAARAARDWTAEWVAAFDIYEPLAWRADVTGDRLFAWIEHFDLVTLAEGSSIDRRPLLASMARQMRHLAHVTAREGHGLQRLKALRGLVAAAAAFGGKRRLDHALARLEREIKLQLHPDGGHRARSPAAQLAAMRCLVDSRAALAAAAVEVPVFLQQAIDRAAPMLRFFRHGDGKLAIFNGSDEEDAATIELVLARGDAKGRAPLSAPHTGFERLQGGGTLVLFECGRPAPPGFDDDAHAGTLSFEMSHGRERLIVNCGCYDGPSTQWRGALRATAAHSTLIVGDTNSTEIAEDGTLGHRPEAVTCQRAEDDGNQWVTATHDGYRRSFGLLHSRRLFLAADGEDLRGEDQLTGTAGRSFAIRFHLHPDVEASLTPDGNVVLLRLASGVTWRLRAEGAVLSIGESIYLGGGELQKTRQVLLDGHVATAGAIVRWAIRREGRSDGAA